MTSLDLPLEMQNSNTVAGGGSSVHQVKKYRFIDALRGYAVLLVIICHTGGAFMYLPYPARKLTNAGWHGVQLFFLISCVTLMMSWRSDEAKHISSTSAFWIRRFFRIAPMYYLAAAFYFYAEPPAGGFDLKQLLASLAFINAWHPALTPTLPNKWTVVPGGWSIGVEFSFYFFFPLLVRLVRSMRSACFFFALSILVAAVANSLSFAPLATLYGDIPTSNFLYFWLPNQLPIFALGTVLFFLIDNKSSPVMAAFNRYELLILMACALLFVLLAEKPGIASLYFSVVPLHLLPHHIAAALVFTVAALLFAFGPDLPFINKFMCELGKVSFSAYLLHFFVLRTLPSVLPFVDLQRSGWSAIGTFFVLLLLVVAVTFALSKATFALVEGPMIKLGSNIANSVRTPA